MGKPSKGGGEGMVLIQMLRLKILLCSIWLGVIKSIYKYTPRECFIPPTSLGKKNKQTTSALITIYSFSFTPKNLNIWAKPLFCQNQQLFTNERKQKASYELTDATERGWKGFSHVQKRPDRLHWSIWTSPQECSALHRDFCLTQIPHSFLHFYQFFLFFLIPATPFAKFIRHRKMLEKSISQPCCHSLSVLKILLGNKSIQEGNLKSYYSLVLSSFQLNSSDRLHREGDNAMETATVEAVTLPDKITFD